MQNTDRRPRIKIAAQTYDYIVKSHLKGPIPGGLCNVNTLSALPFLL